MPLPTTRPDDTPDWGSAAPGADIVEPPAAKQAAAWGFEERVAYGNLNWFWNRVAHWAAHLSASASKFATLEAATLEGLPASTAPLVAGDTFIMGPDSVGGQAGTAAVALNGPALAIACDVTGDEVIYIDSAGVITAYARDGSGLIRTYAAHGLVAIPFAVRADANYVAVWCLGAVQPNVEVYDRSTGASLFVNVVGGVVQDLGLGIGRIYVAQATTAGVDVIAYNAAGVIQWSYDHGNTAGGVSALAVHGEYLYLHGSTSGHGSGAALRSIEAATGKDAAGEGGIGTSALPGVWDDATAAAIAGANRDSRIATDGRVLAVVHSSTTLQMRGCADGLVGLSRTVPSCQGATALDDDYAYCAPDTGIGRVEAYARADGLACAWAYNSEAGVGICITASDGDAVFVVDTLSTTHRTARIRRGSRARLWQRVDPAVDLGLPYRRAVL